MILCEECFRSCTGSCVTRIQGTGHCQELNTPGSLPPNSDNTALISCRLVPAVSGLWPHGRHLSLSLKQFALDQNKNPEGPCDSPQTSSPSGISSHAGALGSCSGRKDAGELKGFCFGTETRKGPDRKAFPAFLKNSDSTSAGQFSWDMFGSRWSFSCLEPFQEFQGGQASKGH